MPLIHRRGFHSKIFDEGGCCYVIGSMRNSKIITAQRMLLVRLYQLAERRERNRRTPPHCYLSFRTEIPFIRASAGRFRRGSG